MTVADSILMGVPTGFMTGLGFALAFVIVVGAIRRDCVFGEALKVFPQRSDNYIGSLACSVYRLDQ